MGITCNAGQFGSCGPCTGLSAGANCTLDCIGNRQCEKNTLSCTDAHGCVVNCDGYDACWQGILNAGQATALEVICGNPTSTTTDGSCWSLTINAQNVQNVYVECFDNGSNDSDNCNSIRVYCGTGLCHIKCVGQSCFDVFVDATLSSQYICVDDNNNGCNDIVLTTSNPTPQPTDQPTINPTLIPTNIPTTHIPSKYPTEDPTKTPSSTTETSSNPTTAITSSNPTDLLTTKVPTTRTPTKIPSTSPFYSSITTEPSFYPITSTPTTLPISEGNVDTTTITQETEENYMQDVSSDSNVIYIVIGAIASVIVIIIIGFIVYKMYVNKRINNATETETNISMNGDTQLKDEDNKIIGDKNDKNDINNTTAIDNEGELDENKLFIKGDLNAKGDTNDKLPNIEIDDGENEDMYVNDNNKVTVDNNDEMNEIEAEEMYINNNKHTTLTTKGTGDV